jgi:aminopeptidase YwaD
MDATWLKSRIAAHVRALAGEIGPRPSGSPANRLATDYLAVVLRSAGFEVQEHPFTCDWWEPGSATLQIGGAWVDVPPSPFSRPCDVRGRVTRLDDDAALTAASPSPGRVIVIGGELTAESYPAKCFPFLDAPEQRARIARLEALEPAAVIAAVPAWRMVPVLEDGDLAFPYLAVPTTYTDRLRTDREIAVRITGALHAGSGINVSARVGGEGPRTVLCAHIDSKVTTPGAFDNAGGVATLLALAESSLADGHDAIRRPIELVFFNGEDHFAAPGEQVWLAATDLGEIELAVNLDGAGVVGQPTSVTLLGCPPDLATTVTGLVASRPGWEIGAPWFESDHAIFAMRGIPAVAITAANAHHLPNVIHTERDTTRMVDAGILADVAAFLQVWLSATPD